MVPKGHLNWKLWSLGHLLPTSHVNFQEFSVPQVDVWWYDTMKTLEVHEVIRFKKIKNKIFRLYIHAVDGSEIRRSPVEVGSLSHYLQGFSTIPGGWSWDFWTIHSITSKIAGFLSWTCLNWTFLWTSAVRKTRRQVAMILTAAFQFAMGAAAGFGDEKGAMIHSIELVRWTIWQGRMLKLCYMHHMCDNYYEHVEHDYYYCSSVSLICRR